MDSSSVEGDTGSGIDDTNMNFSDRQSIDSNNSTSISMAAPVTAQVPFQNWSHSHKTMHDERHEDVTSAGLSEMEMEMDPHDIPTEAVNTDFQPYDRYRYDDGYTYEGGIEADEDDCESESVSISSAPIPQIRPPGSNESTSEAIAPTTSMSSQDNIGMQSGNFSMHNREKYVKQTPLTDGGSKKLRVMGRVTGMARKAPLCDFLADKRKCNPGNEIEKMEKKDKYNEKFKRRIHSDIPPLKFKFPTTFNDSNSAAINSSSSFSSNLSPSTSPNATEMTTTITKVPKTARDDRNIAEDSMCVKKEQHDGKANVWRTAVYYARLSQMGDAAAQCTLGTLHERGRGVERDMARALGLYRLSAVAGYARGQFHLARCHAHGLGGLSVDWGRAYTLYCKAARQGHVPSICNVGVCYHNGSGVVRDVVKAVDQYREAALKEYPRAWYNLGVCYETGEGVQQRDYRRAAGLYRKAARGRFAQALCALGKCYELGTGVQKDEKRAVLLYRKAADRKCARAVFYLGLCYERGVGVDGNFRQAAELFKKAATLGLQDALTYLTRFDMNVREFEQVTEMQDQLQKGPDKKL